ncbi:MAG: regulator [Oscillospiraceae bacterium]|jgi:reactive intermediate/imine deaminase|nr:regulator [Oscillospiraceae bacterium]
MSKKVIATPNAPAAVGPYSQGWIAGDFVYTAGQGGLDPASGRLVSDTVEGQAEQACKNVGAILEEAGASFADVVKTTVFLAHITDFAAFNAVYARYFTEKPARTCVAARDLPLGMLCEIEAVAYIG